MTNERGEQSGGWGGADQSGDPWVSAFSWIVPESWKTVLHSFLITSILSPTYSLSVVFCCLNKLVIQEYTYGEASCLKRYISGLFSVDGPAEPQRCCQQINCPHIPASLVIPPACFLLIKLADLLSPEAAWQTRPADEEAGRWAAITGRDNVVGDKLGREGDVWSRCWGKGRRRGRGTASPVPRRSHR